jgi:hypothetical protein
LVHKLPNFGEAGQLLEVRPFRQQCLCVVFAVAHPQELDRHCKEYATQKAAAAAAAATAMDAETAAAAATADAGISTSTVVKHTAAAQTVLELATKEPAQDEGKDPAGLAAAAATTAAEAATRCDTSRQAKSY